MDIIDYRAFTGSSAQKFFKSTLFQSRHLLLGLNCLDSGQVQAPHAHTGQDKFYFVLEGEGDFTVGDETRRGKTGFAVWAPAGAIHGVANNGTDRLVLLVGIAPAPGQTA